MALITDIRRASFHDGEGIRTTVFFKGCPLRCEWCHNPECISFEPQILSYPERCIGCGMCDKGCYAGAKVRCGREMSPEEIISEILLDKPYYGKDGGVTFSGGEPMAWKEELSRLVDMCRDEGIGCAVETSLIYYDEEIFRKLDMVMADLKIWDSQTHKRYTGVGNERIIENFKRLDKLEVPIVVRTPVIPEIEQGIDHISEFVKGLENVKKYELLPYHPLGQTKRTALGLEADKFTVPQKNYMEELKKYVFIR